jgi:hypothetical protein
MNFPSLQHALTSDEKALFWDQGFLGPYRALPDPETIDVRERIVRDVIGSDAEQTGPAVQCRHLDSRDVYELCALPAIIDRMAQLYGPDLVLWRSNLWCKQPGGAEVAWHQDLTHWPLDPMVNISAWLALDHVDAQNSCLQLIPGSHKHVYPTLQQVGDPLSDTVDPRYVDTSRAVNMEMSPGEFFLFSEKLLHHSGENVSQRRRLGLAIRVTVPLVNVDHSKLLDGRHRNIVIRGTDSVGFNDLQGPPRSSNTATAS